MSQSQMSRISCVPVRRSTARPRQRGNSVYFPDRVVPMLPEALSTDLCSLKPGVERAAMVARLVFDRDGSLKRHSFERAMIVSRAALTYTQSQGAFDGVGSPRTDPLVESALWPLWGSL